MYLTNKMLTARSSWYKTSGVASVTRGQLLLIQTVRGTLLMSETGGQRDSLVHLPLRVHHPHSGSGAVVHSSQLLYEPHMSTV